ncbi:exodeoxyribonuclease III [Pacificimonas flava]|uniref:Exodeoxyribonuclease III n=2 Tax=Pacificimonas TaxID=1960290 RepID=A0A219B2M7_9SPHN|nr:MULTISPECIES: exodeoxyribonuclease III [Pacificimonas]MBZ6378323.1 exodeoxyribonuclease III [Pacificimonas aurantium]OWV32069.1 exodeoxyribonuclease III [Pacificimonas flava]
MRIATYNVNGIKARLPRLLEWLEETKPDVACLQEIKSQTDLFPVSDIEDAGYHALVHGQKGFNGVAILTREPAEEVQVSLPGDNEDEQARYIECDYRGVRIANLYLPNGNPQPGPKFDYKLGWMERLRLRAQTLFDSEIPTCVTGDFNVAPEDRDVFSMRSMANDALVQPESRAALRTIVNQGWLEALRAVHPHDDKLYTFWDYQAGCWPRDAGLRIDHHLLSPQLADRLVDAQVDKEYRGREKASDHAPVWVEIAD